MSTPFSSYPTALDRIQHLELGARLEQLDQRLRDLQERLERIENMLIGLVAAQPQGGSDDKGQ